MYDSVSLFQYFADELLPKMALVSRYMGSCVITLIRYVGVVEHSLYGGGPPAAEIITARICTSDPLKLQNR